MAFSREVCTPYFVLHDSTSFPGSLFFPLPPGDEKKRDPGNEVLHDCL